MLMLFDYIIILPQSYCYVTHISLYIRPNLFIFINNATETHRDGTKGHTNILTISRTTGHHKTNHNDDDFIYISLSVCVCVKVSEGSSVEYFELS